MSCRILFLPNQVEIDVPSGTSILDAAKQAGIFLDAPCGGNGTCGKCEVSLTQDDETSPVLACKTQVQSDCTVTMPQKGQFKILRGGTERAVSFAPSIDVKRIPGSCFAAFDLGTTSIVCYLLDGTTGEQIASAGMQNPQSAYGADVIARANYVLTSDTPNVLQTSVISALNQLIVRTTRSIGRTPDHVTLISIVGNTVMHHILLGLPLEQLVRAPYEPALHEKQVLSAADLSLCVNVSAVVLIAPVIGGFVGADTVACLTATAFEEVKTPTLLLDIGTNGELVLTDGIRRVCCSTAAGPAFEGANISCGMRAESSAVDHVWLQDGILQCSTIESIPARGICGSGLIELIALLVRLGVIDETGRFVENAALANRFRRNSAGMLEFLICDGEKQVTLTQKDVRELQLGKAAIHAGIQVLLDTLSLDETQITHVLLAGAFGSHLFPASLCDIGLLPEAFREKTESIGNAAGEGAKLYARSDSLFSESDSLARETDYIELTRSPVFSEYYIDAMAFPEPQGRTN